MLVCFNFPFALLSQYTQIHSLLFSVLFCNPREADTSNYPTASYAVWIAVGFGLREAAAREGRVRGKRNKAFLSCFNFLCALGHILWQ